MIEKKPRKAKSKKEKLEVVKPDKPVRSDFDNALREFFGSIMALSNVTPWLLVHLIMVQQWHKKKILDMLPEDLEMDESGDILDNQEFVSILPIVNLQVSAMGNFSRANTLVLRSLFMILISQYDFFVSNIYRAVLSAFPDMVDNSNRELKYSDLIKFSSIADARKSILEKEIDEFMRKKRGDQVDHLSKRIGLPDIKQKIPCWKEFVEIVERRNLIVHTNGVVNEEYLSACKIFGCAIDPNLKVGDSVVLDIKYLTDAFHIVGKTGFIFGQMVWRKVVPLSLRDADASLNDSGYRALLERKYELARDIFEFGCGGVKGHHDDSTEKMLFVNYANSYRLLGQLAKAKEILEMVDWSSAAPEFRLAVEVIKEDYEAASKIMKTIGSKGAISKKDYYEWPLFRGFRSAKSFQRVYQEVFGEKFILTPKKKNKRKKSREGMDSYIEEFEAALKSAESGEKGRLQMSPDGFSIMFKQRNQKKIG